MEKTWTTINETLNKSNKVSNVTSIFYHNGITLSSTKDIANTFNVYFVNIEINLRQKLSRM